LRLALAIENRYADFQGSGLRLRFSSASVAPVEKIVATAFSLKDRYAIFNSACSAFFCGRLIANFCEFAILPVTRHPLFL